VVLPSRILSLVREKTKKSTIKIPYEKYCAGNPHHIMAELRGEVPRQ
jgi:hypothetical protein